MTSISNIRKSFKCGTCKIAFSKPKISKMRITEDLSTSKKPRVSKAISAKLSTSLKDLVLDIKTININSDGHAVETRNKKPAIDAGSKNSTKQTPKTTGEQNTQEKTNKNTK